MCLELRNTVKRGRSGVPTIVLRTCRRRRSRRRCLTFCASIGTFQLLQSRLLSGSLFALLRSTGKRLALLAANLFILVANALALVRFRLANFAHFRGELPDLLFVGSAND